MKKTSAVEVSIQAVSPALMCIPTSDDAAPLPRHFLDQDSPLRTRAPDHREGKPGTRPGGRSAGACVRTASPSRPTEVTRSAGCRAVVGALSGGQVKQRLAHIPDVEHPDQAGVVEDRKVPEV